MIGGIPDIKAPLITITQNEHVNNKICKFFNFSRSVATPAKNPPHKPPRDKALCENPYNVSDISKTSVITIGSPTIRTADKTILKAQTKNTTERKTCRSFYTNR